MFSNRHLQLFIEVFITKSCSHHQLLLSAHFIKNSNNEKTVQRSISKISIKLCCQQFSLIKAIEVGLMSEVSTGMVYQQTFETKNKTDKLVKSEVRRVGL